MDMAPTIDNPNPARETQYGKARTPFPMKAFARLKKAWTLSERGSFAVPL